MSKISLFAKDSVDALLDSVEDGATRSRVILLVLIISSFVTLINAFHTRSDTWAKGMVSISKFSDLYIDFETDCENENISNYNIFIRQFYDSIKFNTGPAKDSLISNYIIWPNWITIKDPEGYWSKLANQETKLSTKQVDNLNSLCHSVGYISHHNIRSYEELNLRFSDIIVETKKRKIIDVPFFGGWFYINDIGVFSGISLSIILILLAINIFTERSNIKMFLETARVNTKELRLASWDTINTDTDSKHFLIFMYNMAVSKQLFAVPFTFFYKYIFPNRKESNSTLKDWKTKRLFITIYRSFAVSIVCLPVWTYYCLVQYDKQTFLKGWSNSPGSFDLTNRLEFFFLLLIIILSCSTLIAWTIQHYAFDRFFIKLLDNMGDKTSHHKYSAISGSKIRMNMWVTNGLAIIFGVLISTAPAFYFFEDWTGLIRSSIVIISVGVLVPIKFSISSSKKVKPIGSTS